MAGAGQAIDQNALDEWRARILADPGLVLDDPEVMRSLVLASEQAMGGNVVDLRSMAMERLESRIERLEDTHRAVIAAAYENLSSTNQIHRAILKMLDGERFEDFVLSLGGSVAEVLRVDCQHLVLETADGGAAPEPLKSVMAIRGPGYVERYMSLGRSVPPRQIVLRQIAPADQSGSHGDGLYGDRAPDLRSEALLRLDMGPDRLPAMLAMGSEDPHRFKPGQGTDLLAFFAGTFERVLRRWLA